MVIIAKPKNNKRLGKAIYWQISFIHSSNTLKRINCKAIPSTTDSVTTNATTTTTTYIVTTTAAIATTATNITATATTLLTLTIP